MTYEKSQLVVRPLTSIVHLSFVIMTEKSLSSGGGLLDDPLARLLNELEPVPLASRLRLLDPDDTGAPHIMLLLAAGKKHLNQRVFGQGSHGGARESV